MYLWIGKPIKIVNRQENMKNNEGRFEYEK